jgi:MFS family permease
MNFFERFLWHFFKINLSNVNDRNAWYLVLEMFWASILGSIAVFNAAFAIRLGADNFQVGLLASIPALMAVLVSIPAGQFLQRRSRRTPWVYGSLLAHRSGYLLVALAPLLGFIGIEPGLLVVLILVGISAPAHFFNVGWIPLLADVVPENRRAAVFTARNIINQATLSVMVFLCGQWLNQVVFPINYQVMYLFGFFASMLSMYYLYKLAVPDSHVVQQEEAPKTRTAGEFLRSTRQALAGQPAFLRITVNTLLHGFGVWMAGPLYALYFVRVLNANDAWLGLNGTVASVGTIAGYSLWRWLMTRWGEPVSLKRTIVLVGIYPVLVGLTPSLPVILIFGALNGLIIPGVNLSHFNTLLKVTPGDARPRYTAIYMTIMNIGATICPLISVALASLVGLEVMLIVSGLLSIIGSTSFWWWPVIHQEVPAHPVPEPAA